MSDPYVPAPVAKPIYASMTMQGLFAALLSILAALPAWSKMSAFEQGALVSAGASWIWALIGRFRQGDIKIIPGKASAAFLFVCLGLGLGLAGCAATPQVAAQKGNEAGALSGGVSPTAPVNQGMSPIITNVFPVLVIGNGTASESPEAIASLVKALGTTVNAGHEANGDVKAQGRQEGGGQSSSQESGQKADAKTDAALGLGDSAIEALKPAVPVVVPKAQEPEKPAKVETPAEVAPPPAAPAGG